MRGVLTRRGHEGWRNVWVLTCMGSNMYGKVSGATRGGGADMGKCEGAEKVAWDTGRWTSMFTSLTNRKEEFA